MTLKNDWPRHAYLDALRPEAGWSVDFALVATYSADIDSVVAALLALAGRDTDAAGGSAVDLAESVEQLRGRAVFVMQEGRFSRPPIRPNIAVLLDQFIKSVAMDAATGSWHPKLAVLCFKTETHFRWRLWIGSRNLTTTHNLDFGVTLDGEETTSAKGKAIDGAAVVVRELAIKAKLQPGKAAALASRCGKVRWQMPKGLDISQIYLLGPHTPELPRPAPEHANEVVIVSPFLDGKFITEAGRWGTASTKRRLLSTLKELRKLAHQKGEPLHAFQDNLAMLAAPLRDATDPSPDVATEDNEDDTSSPEEEELFPGLHAKIIAVRHGQKWRLWVGSANATVRGWSGSNVEIVALCHGDRLIGGGLDSLLSSAQNVQLSELLNEPVVPEDEFDVILQTAKNSIVSQFSGHLARDGNVFEIVVESDFHPADTRICIQAGLLTGQLIDWPAGAHSLQLGTFELAEQTGLVQWRIGLGDFECSWLQCMEVRPEVAVGRDHAAIAARLSPSEFMAWVRSLLSGEPTGVGGGHGSWKETSSAKVPFASLTLEEVLSSRARKGNRLSDLDRRVGIYLDAVLRRAAGDAEMTNRLVDFKELWQLVCGELIR